MDYLPYRRTNHGITIYSILISVDLAQYEIFRAEFVSSVKGSIIILILLNAQGVAIYELGALLGDLKVVN